MSRLRQPILLNQEYTFLLERDGEKSTPILRYKKINETDFHPAEYIRCNTPEWSGLPHALFTANVDLDVGGRRLPFSVPVSLTMNDHVVAALKEHTQWTFVLDLRWMNDGVMFCGTSGHSFHCHIYDVAKS